MAMKLHRTGCACPQERDAPYMAGLRLYISPKQYQKHFKLSPADLLAGFGLSRPFNCKVHLELGYHKTRNTADIAMLKR